MGAMLDEEEQKGDGGRKEMERRGVEKGKRKRS